MLIIFRLFSGEKRHKVAEISHYGLSDNRDSIDTPG